MKRMIAFLALVGMMMVSKPAIASEYEDTQSHPLRVVAYLVHPIGYAFEWVFFRPLHWVVSQPNLEEVFGHVPHGGEIGTEADDI
jgi:hypothetical protein